MYRITCTIRKTGEKLFYTTRSGQHDVGPEVAAHEFTTLRAAELRAEELRGFLSFNTDFDMAVDPKSGPEAYESYLNGRDRF